MITIQSVNDVDLTSWLVEEAEELITDIFVDLTAPPPIGNPVDSGFSRDAWQIDNSNPMAPELYNTAPYENKLIMGSSKQSPPGWFEAILDKNAPG